MEPVQAFILAGGRSSRMGQDKAFLRLGSETLLEHALTLARSITDVVSIVGQSEKFASHGPVIEDSYPDRGPLAGIHAALRASTADLNLVLAVDTPWLSPEFLRYLVQQAAQSAATVTVPRVGGHTQPLCAVYRRGFAEIAEKSLLQGRNKIDPLYAQVSTQIVDESELRRLAFDPRMFDNLNTPEDWEKAAGERP